MAVRLLFLLCYLGSTTMALRAHSIIQRRPTLRLSRCGNANPLRSRAAIEQASRSARRVVLRSDVTIQLQNSTDSPSLTTMATPPECMPIPKGLMRMRTMRALWRFTRPHTLIGSAVSIPALHAFAIDRGTTVAIDLWAKSVLFALAPSLLINVYIVGLNQVFDIKADKINKPNLPLASGELTRREGVILSLGCLAAGLGFGCLVPSRLSTAPLHLTLLGSVLLGTAYSLPPLRLKRFPMAASLSITTVRGALVNWGFFASASAIFYAAPWSQLSPRFVAVGLFYLVFGVVIALLKDLPDRQGDAASGISTFARLGPKTTFQAALIALQAALIAVSVALGFAATSSGHLFVALQRGIAGVVALSMASLLHLRSRHVDVTDPSSSTAFYMSVWKLFYLTYLILPLAR
jgi:homogentisate phytyltransferase/homogentisate geranylgeranyltransferase